MSAILLLSDGAQTRGTLTPAEGAARAKQARVPMYTIALGTDEGTIEVFRFGETQTMSVPPDRPTLQEIAETTGGEYFDAPDAERVKPSTAGSARGSAEPTSSARSAWPSSRAGGRCSPRSRRPRGGPRLPRLP